MKYKEVVLAANAAGIFKSPEGWRIHTVIFAEPSGKHIRVLLEESV